MTLVGLILCLLLAVTETRVWSPRSEAQRAAFRSTAPELCYSGRRFGGKSNVGCMKAYAYASKYPGARVAVCREERSTMEMTTLLTLRSEVVPPAIWFGQYGGGWSESKSTLYLPNKSEINVFGLDKPGRQLGSRFGMAVVDQAEQLSENQFELLNSSITQPGMPFHQLMLLFNPESPEHWAFKRYLPDEGDGKRIDENGRHFADVVHVLPEDLMDLLSEGSRARLDGLAGVWKQRLRLGLWTSFEGAIYGSVWNPATMVVDKPDSWASWNGFPPPTWPRYRAVDFGFKNPFVCQWWAKDPEGVFWMYREIYHSGILTEAHAKRIKALEEGEVRTLRACADADFARDHEPYLEQLHVPFSFCDPAAPDKRLELANAGVFCHPGNNDVMTGIEKITSLLAAGRMKYVKGALDAKDPVLVDRKVPWCSAMEKAGYRWVKDVASNSASGPREIPFKENDHACDAERYLFNHPAVA